MVGIEWGSIEWGSVEWGTAGEWFSGLGGFLAVAVAVGFGLVEHRRASAARMEAQAAERRTLEAERRGKASRVWIQGSGSVSTNNSVTLYYAIIYNGGGSMFRNVHAFVTWHDGTGDSTLVGEVPPDLNPRRVEIGRDGPDPVGGPEWRIEYTDVDGLRWSHSSNGELARLADGDIEP